MRDVCPKCSAVIDESRKYDPIVVCQGCGHIVSGYSEKAEKSNYWSFTLNVFIFCLFVTGVFFYIRQWSNFSLKALPIQTKAMLGMASVPDFEQLQSICLGLRDVDCVADLNSKIQKKQPGHLLSLKRFAHTQYQVKNYDRSAAGYSEYFMHDGRGLKELYEYGVSLTQIGKFEKAKEIFEVALESNKDRLQISVYQKYVELLILMGEKQKAKQTILYVREKATRSFNFMEKELAQL